MRFIIIIVIISAVYVRVLHCTNPARISKEWNQSVPHPDPRDGDSPPDHHRRRDFDRPRVIYKTFGRGVQVVHIRNKTERRTRRQHSRTRRHPSPTTELTEATDIRHFVSITICTYIERFAIFAFVQVTTKKK